MLQTKLYCTHFTPYNPLTIIQEWRKVNRKISTVQKTIKEKQQKGEADVDEKNQLESLKQDILYIEVIEHKIFTF